MTTWIPIDDDHLPPLDVPVLLYDAARHAGWIGGRADDPDGWLWGSCYSAPYLDSNAGWLGDLEADDDYHPTHWTPLPAAPSGGTERSK